MADNINVVDETYRNARAYGWEIGNGAELSAEVPLSENNPFADPDWWKPIGIDPTVRVTSTQGD